MLAIVVGAAVFAGGGSPKPPVADDNTPVQDQQDKPENENQGQTESQDEKENEDKPAQSKPLQVEWTSWAKKLPDGVTEADYEIEKRILQLRDGLEKEK